MNSNFLIRPFKDLLDEACERDPELKSDRAKTRAVLEDYAIANGVGENKLLCIHVFDDAGEVNDALRRHVMETYPLADSSRASYLTRIKSLIRAVLVVAQGSEGKEKSSLIDLQLPEEMRPILVFIPRVNVQGVSSERRLQAPYSQRGQFFLLACIEVWRRHEISSLAALFKEHRPEILKAIKRIAAPRSSVYGVQYLLHEVVRGLGVSDGKVRVMARSEDLLEPFKTEVEIFKKLATTLGDSNSVKTDSERKFEENLLEKAARGGITLRKIRPQTVKGFMESLLIFYGHIRPAIESQGLTRFSVTDLIEVATEVVEEGGRPVSKTINFFVELYRERERARESRYKRIGFDSHAFSRCLGAIRSLAAFNGYVGTHLDDFKKAYRKIVLDRESIERKKAIKKRVFSLDFVDGQLTLLRTRFEKIVTSKSYMGSKGMSFNEAVRDRNLCFFYVIFTVLRYLSYRQQCVRNCVLGKNITFKRDGSITLFWAEDEVKNKKPIKVTLTKDRYDGRWEPVMHALQAYKKIHDYVVQSCRERGMLDQIEGQFFVHLNGKGEFTRFPDNSRDFTTWFKYYAGLFLIYPDEAVELHAVMHPHFLRGLCTDWMHSIGMSEEEIAIATGDTTEVIKAKYRDRHAVQDATRVLANTDRRLRDEARKEIDFAVVLRQQDEARAAELTRRDVVESSLRQENEQIFKELQDTRAELSSVRAALEQMQVTRDYDQLEISRELLAKLNHFADAVPSEKRAKRQKVRKVPVS